MLHYKHYLVIYGGQSSLTGSAVARSVRPVHSDIFMFDLTTKTWHDVKVKNSDSMVNTRRNHCGAILGDWMLVYGGIDTCIEYLNDLQAFSFRALEWSKLKPVG